ncbi:MAG TPA: hypothetical protein PLF01_01525 [Alphaproteobacteria bacterium]|nr:hypothetical protein [Alphaproteobacteria bacterium]
MREGITESRFYMWRAVVAMVHADGVVTPHELAFVNDYLADIDLSAEQIEMVGHDLQTPQDVYEMFARITDRQDKKDFFALARALSWCDGDYDGQEKIIIEHLEKVHMNDDIIDILEESREIFNEVELNQNQWNAKSSQTQKLFGFLNKLKTA